VGVILAFLAQGGALAQHHDYAEGAHSARRSCGRTPCNFRLPQSKLDTARRILGTKTETETIERALDLVAFGERLARGTEEVRGLPWTDALGERGS
jgi:hypothetical protein